MKPILLSLLLAVAAEPDEWYLPVNCPCVTSIDDVKLTGIGRFGLLRKARPGVPAHYHTGADIARPGSNYDNEPVFPAHTGAIISVVDNGPFSQIIIEHVLGGDTLWTVYEHVHVLRAEIGAAVTPFDTIARLFNKEELNNHGWQFDHIHFEVNKRKPLPVKPSRSAPSRCFITYALTCLNREVLNDRLYDPIVFLHDKMTLRNSGPCSR